MERLPAGAVATIAAQAEHDEAWIDPAFTSALTSVIVHFKRKAGRVASLDLIDGGRRFADDLRLRDAECNLALRDPGLFDREISETEVTDTPLMSAMSSERSATCRSTRS